MTLRLILGRAGSGKSALCLKELAEALRQGEEGPPLILLVPEQATLQVERELVLSLESQATSRALVLSFRRLAWRVFQEVGGAARPHLGELGKRMALRALLERQRSAMDLFAPLVERPGFSKQLAQTIAELRAYRVEPEKLNCQAALLEKSGRGKTPLALKLKDLAILYESLEVYLAGRYLDPDDYLNLLAGQLGASSLIQGALVWVDGFIGFTPQEETVLKALFLHAARVSLTLCLDTGELSRPASETDLFLPPRETLERLSSLAKSSGVVVESEALGGRPRFLSPALSHLESCWPDRIPRIYPERPEGLRLVAATNPRAEVEAAARELLRLAREHGCRWREMAILACDLESYHDLLQNVLKDFGIPCFVDRRRAIAHHPLLELIRSALEAILENWAYEPLFRYLKSDLVPLSRQAVDKLENYVLAHGIRGKSWKEEEPWLYRRRLSLEGEGEETPGEVFSACLQGWRKRASSSLRHLESRVTGPGAPFKVRRLAGALMQLLLDLKVPRQLELWCRRAVAEGDPEAAQEHQQAWNGILDTLEQMVEALGEESLPLADFAQILEDGLDSLRLGLVPPSLDQVVAGSLERSRHPALKALLILGANEGVWPARQGEDSIFGDEEREELGARGLELAPTARRRSLREQYLAYLALTRPSTYLWVSYPLANREGKSLPPSPIVRRLRQIYPALEPEAALAEPTGRATDLDLPVDARSAAALLLRRLEKLRDQGGSIEPAWREVYHWLLGHGPGRANLRAVTGGLFQANLSGPLSPALASALFGEKHPASVSRLETFASCPFAHFAAYGLRLQERALFSLEAPEKGVFYHEALRRLVEELWRSGQDLGAMPGEEAASLAGKIAGELARGLKGEILLSTARYRYLLRRLTSTLSRAVEALAEHCRVGSFRPAAVELGFGEEGGMPSLALNLGNGRTMSLRGRIDRVDLAGEGETLYLRVVDYKSRPIDMDFTKVYHGLSLQLPLYLKVALDWALQELGIEARPAGLLYFPVHDPLARVKTPPGQEEAGASRIKKLKMRGLLLGEPAAVSLMDGRAGSSPLVPAELKQDGSLGKRTRSASAGEMASLWQLAVKRAEGICRSVQEGETAIAPYHLGQETPCGFCRFRPVCAFDPALTGRGYRVLARLSEEDFWLQASEETRGGSPDA